MRIFFTDLDGTLLDHNTYSFDGALEGLDLLMREDVKPVPVTSKTADEVLELMKNLDVYTPFVFENGYGIGVCLENGEYEYVTDNRGVSFLREYIPLVQDFFGSDIKILNDISPDEMNTLTGLGTERSGLALKRRGSLLFLPVGDREKVEDELVRLNISLDRCGVKVTRGGRFYHLISADCGKDYGVKKVIEYYEKNNIKVEKTGAAGDSLNDIPMLKEVDYPYIVKKSDGTWIETGFQVFRTENRGPYGFTEAVKDFLIKTAGI